MGTGRGHGDMMGRMVMVVVVAGVVVMVVMMVHRRRWCHGHAVDLVRGLHEVHVGIAADTGTDCFILVAGHEVQRCSYAQPRPSILHRHRYAASSWQVLEWTGAGTSWGRTDGSSSWAVPATSIASTRNRLGRSHS